MSNELSKPEKTRYASLKRVIKKGQKAFVEVGNALIEVRDKKLYRAEHDTFEKFCFEEYGFTRFRAYQLIDASEIVGEIKNGEMSNDKGLHRKNVDHGTQNPLPNERQARALKDAPKGERGAAWNEAKSTAPKGKVTAKHVEKVVAKRRQEDPPATVEAEQQFVDEPPERVIEQLPKWTEVADVVDEAIGLIRQAISVMRKGFAVQDKEITHPYAKRYSHTGSIGHALELIRYLENGKPVGEDSKGAITAGDAAKRQALGRK